MRLAPADFWNLSLPEFLLMMDGHRQQQDADYHRTGTIVAAIYNVNRDTKKYGILSASDIFPFLPRQSSDSGMMEAINDDEDEIEI